MNLNEILNQRMTRSDVEQALCAAGWRFLSCGYYSSVYEHSQSHHVIKVGCTYADGYLAYALWCAANRGLPHIPVIHSITEGGTHRPWYVVEMRRYSDIVDRGTYGAARTKEMQKQWTMACCFLPRKASHDIEYSTEPMDPQRMLAMGETMRKLIAFFGDVCEWDFHSENAMWCERTEQLIITDPLHGMKRAALDDRLDKLGSTRLGMSTRLSERAAPKPVAFADMAQQEAAAQARMAGTIGKQARLRLDRQRMAARPELQIDFRKLDDLAMRMEDLRQPIIQKMALDLRAQHCAADAAFVARPTLAKAARPPKGSMSFLRDVAKIRPGIPHRNQMFDRLAQQALAKDERFL